MRNKHRTDRGKQHAMRTEPSTTNIDIEVLGEVHEASVLRLVHPRGNLFVAFTEESMAPVLRHLWEHGFAE